MDNIEFEFETEKKVYNFITNYPLSTSNAICKKLNLEPYLVNAALTILRKKRYIFVYIDNDQERYYPSKGFNITNVITAIDINNEPYTITGSKNPKHKCLACKIPVGPISAKTKNYCPNCGCYIPYIKYIMEEN